MSSPQAVGDLVSQPYKYGFVTDIETEKIAKGLSEDVCATDFQQEGGASLPA